MSASPSSSARTARVLGMWRSRTCKALISAGTVATLAVMTAPGASAAAAAPTGPTGAAGNFLDATLGGNPIDQLAELKYARAVAPPDSSEANPLDVTALGALNLPLTGVINLPTAPAVDAGVVNQVAYAKSNGTATGKAGAVDNSGGVDLGANGTGADNPPVASVHLGADDLGAIGGIPGLSAIPLPGLTSLIPSGPSLPGLTTDTNALGGVDLKIGAVTAIAHSKTGSIALPKIPYRPYNIAGVQLSLGSPLLGGVLKQLLGASDLLQTTLDTVLGPLTSATGPLQSLLNTLTSGNPLLGSLNLSAPISALTNALGKCTGITTSQTLKLASGGVTIDGSTGTITVDLAKVLEAVKLNINDLPANTDLLAYVLHELPRIIYNLITGVVDTVLTPLEDQFATCLSAFQDASDAIAAVPGLGAVLNQILDTLLSGLSSGLTQLDGLKTTLESTFAPFVDQLQTAFAPGVDALSNGLAMLLDIGVNVESGPGKQADNSKYLYTTALDPTVKQGDPSVGDNQLLIRAIEVKVAGAGSGGLSSLGGGLPGISSLTDLLSGGTGGFSIPTLPLGIVGQQFGPLAAAPSTGLIVLALANAAVSPGGVVAPPTSSTPAPPTSAPPTTAPPNTNIPTGVDAGRGTHGSPALPLVLLLAGLVMAAAGAVSYRFKIGRHSA